MINWSEVAPALHALFSDIATPTRVSPAFRAQWAHAAQEMIHPQVQMNLQLRVTNVTGVGEDEARFEATPGVTPAGVRETLVGQRRFIVEVRVDSLEHCPERDGWALSMIERIRTRLSRTASQQRLQAVNVALIDCGAATDVSTKFDKHRVNAAVMDVVFYGAFNDGDPVALGVIEHIEATSLLENTDGTVLSEPPNFTDRLMP